MWRSQKLKAKIWNYKKWIKCIQESDIKNFYEHKLLKSGFKVLGIVEHKFKPQGYTVLFLLAESHFAVHTFPEHNKMYIELSSCNKEKYKTFKGELWQEKKQIIQ